MICTSSYPRRAPINPAIKHVGVRALCSSRFKGGGAGVLASTTRLLRSSEAEPRLPARRGMGLGAALQLRQPQPGSLRFAPSFAGGKRCLPKPLLNPLEGEGARAPHPVRTFPNLVAGLINPHCTGRTCGYGSGRELILETVLTLVQGVAQWIIDRRVAFDRLEFVSRRWHTSTRRSPPDAARCAHPPGQGGAIDLSAQRAHRLDLCFRRQAADDPSGARTARSPPGALARGR